MEPGGGDLLVDSVLYIYIYMCMCAGGLSELWPDSVSALRSAVCLRGLSELTQTVS